MKRAKLMLAAVAVLAVIGGVFASKAQRQSFSLFVSNGTPGQCPLQVFGITTTNNGTPPVVRYATPIAGACPLTSVYITD